MISKLYWLSLKPETRKNLAVFLEIPKTSGVIVEDGRVMGDGYTDDDLATVTLVKLQEYMGSTETDFLKLFQLLIDRLEGKMVEVPEAAAPIEEKEVITTPTEVIEKAKKKMGRPKKLTQ